MEFPFLCGGAGRGPAVQPAHARLHSARRPVDGAHDRPHPPRRVAVNTERCTYGSDLGPRCPCVVVEYNAGVELAEARGAGRPAPRRGRARRRRARAPAAELLFAFVGGFAFIGAAMSRCASTLRRAALFLSVSPSRWIFTLSPFARGTFAQGSFTFKLFASLAAKVLGHARARLEVGRLVRQTTPRNLAFFQILPAA